MASPDCQAFQSIDRYGAEKKCQVHANHKISYKVGISAAAAAFSFCLSWLFNSLLPFAMFSTLSSSLSLSRVIQFALVFGSLGRLVQAADDDVQITDIFNVKTDSSKGSCAGKIDLLNSWLKDAREVASAPIAVAEQALEYDQPSMEYMWTYFKILGMDESDTQTALDNLRAVKGFLDGTTTPSDGKPSLYCDDGWQKMKQWESATDRTRIDQPAQQAIQGKTALWETFVGYYFKYFLKKNLDLTDTNTDVPPMYPWWVEDHKQYVFATPDGGLSCKSKTTMGSVQQQVSPRLVTLCLGNSGGDMKNVLEDNDPVNSEGALVQPRRTMSLTLYHEALHITIGPSSEDYAYRFSQITGNKDTLNTGGRIIVTEALRNPESYTHFALATWLETQYPAFTFNSGQSKLKD
ncbi:hypothetical protein B0T10DRAFT_568138 [Thelonectria olida]|uniref:Uncharacterized protein n=1 Tax=Thelonectria olida TaxID=1576542 RepID=A0A9P8VRN6_9HYPO|nr:hypothetical protein B0T10DRAFT_568138 [Thelonectria olida]